MLGPSWHHTLDCRPSLAPPNSHLQFSGTNNLAGVGFNCFTLFSLKNNWQSCDHSGQSSSFEFSCRVDPLWFFVWRHFFSQMGFVSIFCLSCLYTEKILEETVGLWKAFSIFYIFYYKQNKKINNRQEKRKKGNNYMDITWKWLLIITLIFF